MKTWQAFPAYLIAALLVMAAPTETSARPSGVFSKLKGNWRGSGRILLTGGNSQRIACRAYYTVKEAGAGLGLAIRCASQDNKIELRARLSDNDGKLSGNWEERTYNATGNVSGRASPGRVTLAINGSISGSMRISYTGRRQTVSISTEAEGLTGISIDLRR